MKRIIHKVLATSTLLCAFALAQAAEIHVPAVVEAGKGFAVAMDGSGSATFYLIGPDHVVKRKINLGGDLQITSSDVRTAGQYQIILCQHSCNSTSFEVKAAQPARLSFFLHPSRVPVSSRDSIDATAWVFDQYSNLVLTPTTVDFQIKPASGSGFTRQTSTRNGVTSLLLDSTPREGPVQVTAAINSGGVAGVKVPGAEVQVGLQGKEARVIQQVAAEACRLHMNVVASGDKVTIETDPVRDCSGNALPDGTIVSFTTIDREGRSTVDTPIKKGVARTQLRLAGPARLSVACGVVLGNEITIGGRL
jgi:hypothetical protein